MALNKVVISVNNFALSQTQATDDNIVGLVVKDTGSGKTANTNYKITSLDEYNALNITADSDTDKLCKQYFNESGNYSLYLRITDKDLGYILDKTKVDGAKSLLEFANGGINVLGISGKKTFVNADYNTTGDKSLPKEIIQGVTNGQGLADDYKASKSPISIVIAGNGFKKAEVANISSINDKNSVSVFCQDSIGRVNLGFACVLGSLGKIPVQRKISRVKNGSLNLIDLSNVGVISNSVADSLNTKKYISLRKFLNDDGWYFTNDFSLTSSNDNLNTISSNRVINKAIRIVNGIVKNEIGNDVLTNSDGTLQAIVARDYEGSISTELETQMQDNNEIVGKSVVVDTSNNIVTDKTLKMNIGLTPVGYTENINITIAYTLN